MEYNTDALHRFSAALRDFWHTMTSNDRREFDLIATDLPAETSQTRPTTPLIELADMFLYIMIDKAS